MVRIKILGTMAAVMVLLSACTMKKQDAPDLAGPSELGISLQMIANPDVLAQDGGSHALLLGV